MVAGRASGWTRVPDSIAELREIVRPAADSRDGPLPALLVMLTVLTGVVDAASYLKLGHVFVANMTGNIVFLGFAIAGAGGISIAGSLAAIGSFLLGAFAGGWLGATNSAHRGHLLRAAAIAQALLIVAALLVALLAPHPLGGGTHYALLAPLAASMGVQNAAAQRLAIPELTTTVLTKTLTGIASEAKVLGGRGSQLGRRGLSVAAMLLGAICGGLLVVKVSIASALALALFLSAVVGVAVFALSTGEPEWRKA